MPCNSLDAAASFFVICAESPSLPFPRLFRGRVSASGSSAARFVNVETDPKTLDGSGDMRWVRSREALPIGNLNFGKLRDMCALLKKPGVSVDMTVIHALCVCYISEDNQPCLVA